MQESPKWGHQAVITHDLDGLDEVDEIVVLDRGKIVERGRYDQLIESDGAFTRLWRQRHPPAHPAGGSARRPDVERIPA